MESVKVTIPLVEVTLTKGMATIRVESYTLPVIQIWDLAFEREAITINIGKSNLMYFIIPKKPTFQKHLDNACAQEHEFFQPVNQEYRMVQPLISPGKGFYHDHIPHPQNEW